MRGLDISNYNAFTPAYAQQLKDAGQGVIVRGALPIERPGLVDISKRQLQIAQDAGLPLLGVYGWAYFDSADPDTTARQLVDLYGPYDPPKFWIDCEANNLPTPGQNEDWLAACLDELDTLGRESGIYTGRWWWIQWQNMNNSTMFNGVPLWAATDDKNPDLKFIPFGGWTRLMVEQYDLSGPDRDVFAEDYLTGRVAVSEPSVDEKLSYLGGLTHDVIPQVIAELQGAEGESDPWAMKPHIDRALAALKPHAG